MEVYLELILAKIKELPVFERPREKAMRYGLDSLSSEELIAILIRTGTKDASALDISHRIYSESHGLINLFHKSYQALLDINGIGPGKALVLSACFELCNRYFKLFNGESESVNSVDIYKRYVLKMKKSNKETFVLLVLNRKKEIIHEENLYQGSEFHIDCQPMEIIKKVILHNGAYFYMIHNHPSGDYQPSPHDVDFTTRIIATANRVNVEMVDHIIVGDNGFYSFKVHDKLSSIPLINN